MHRTLTYISYAVMALFAMTLTVTGPLLPAISRSFGLGMAEAGLVFTANFAGFVAFILVGGVLADRWGKKRVLSVALAGFAVSLLLVPLGLQLPFAAMAGTWQRYRFERRRSQALRRVLARLLPPDLVERFIEQLASTGAVGWPIHGVCLASDMQGYTGLAEALGPRTLAERLNAYYARLFGPVERHGGFVSDVVGDAMVAIWGATGDDPAVRRSALPSPCQRSVPAPVSYTHLTLLTSDLV